MTDDERRETQVFDALGRVVAQVPPPASLRARVLAQALGTASPPIRPAVTPPTARVARLLTAAAAILAVVTSLGWWMARRDVVRVQSAAAILSASDVAVHALAGVSPADAARARVYLSPTRGLFMAAENLPALPDGRVYQLWTIVGGRPISAGIFEREADGGAHLIGSAPPGAPEALAVTVEPSGGMSVPTGPKYLLGAPAS